MYERLPPATLRMAFKQSSCILLLATTSVSAPARTDRLNLFPKLQAGQTVTYQISYRTGKRVSTQSSVILADAPADTNVQVRALLRLEVLGLEVQGPRATIHARTQFQS